MSHPPKSLFRTLLKSMLLPSMIAIILGGSFAFLTVREEYDELLDIGLTNRAYLLLNLMQTSPKSDDQLSSPKISELLAFEYETHDPTEQTVFWLLDETGRVLQRSPLALEGMFPEGIEEGFTSANGYRFRLLKAESGSGPSIIVGEPLHERNEAIRDIIVGVMLSFLALVAIMWFATISSLRRSVESIEKLSEDIADKSEHNLTPIDRSHSFQEIEPAINTLDELMGRLNTAIMAEREFATVAAHELRTPVAICIAHVQRLKATLEDPKAAEKATSIEQGLKRLTRLIERLLQLSRAQSGLGTIAETSDLNEVTKLLIDELKDRLPKGHKIEIDGPKGTFESNIDPDAFGIMLSNLFDNAVKYSDDSDGIKIDAATSGEISISNDCDPLTADEVTEVTKRFVRKSNLADGHGLGLSIVQALCEQTGSALEIQSPMRGSVRGFTATLKLPPQTYSTVKD